MNLFPGIFLYLPDSDDAATGPGWQYGDMENFFTHTNFFTPLLPWILTFTVTLFLTLLAVSLFLS